MSDNSEMNDDAGNAAMDDWAAAMEEQKAASDAAAPTAPEPTAASQPAAEDPVLAAQASAVAEPAAAPEHESAKMPELSASPAGPKADSGRNLDVILDVPVTLAMEIGRTRVPIRNLLQLTQGSVVELDRLAGEPLDVTVNGTLIAHGEVVVVNERYGIRFTDVISAAERAQKLK